MSLKARPCPIGGGRGEKGVPTHPVPKEEEVTEVVERATRWAGFYTGLTLPQAQRQRCISDNFPACS